MRHHTGDFILNVADQFRDFLDRLGALIRQLAHFLGDNSKPPAVLAGTGCLNGSIERKQVRLFGDVRDKQRNVADLIGVCFELLDSRPRPFLIVSQLIDAANERIGDIAACLQRFGHPIYRLFRSLGCFFDLHGDSKHILGRRSRFLDRLGRRRSPFGNVVNRRCNIACTA